MKSRPLVASSLHEESVNACHFISSSIDNGGITTTTTTTTTDKTGMKWFTRLRESFNQSLILDRHYLSELENNMCIASLPESTEFHSVDGHRLILAQRSLNLRELPVSLLRLFFAGQQHFESILDRLTNKSFYTLLNYLTVLTHDYGTYYDRRNAIKESLIRIIDYTFCSFERSLEKVLSVLQDTNGEEYEEWFHNGLFQSLANDSYWVGFPIPHAFRRLLLSPTNLLNPNTRAQLNESGALLWYTAVWRMNNTIILEKLVKPWHDEESREWLIYRLKLFRNTHLDLLSVMVKEDCFDDQEIYTRQYLRSHYPTCNRVCCAEELPDLSCYAMDNFKTGSHLKERTTLPEKIGHYSCIKTVNNICKDRNWWEIIRTYGEQHPIIYDHIKYSIKCVMLGHLPRAMGSLDIMASIRINISFWSEYADEVMTREEIDDYMPEYCHPFLVAERKRATKLHRLRNPKKKTAKKMSEKKISSEMQKFDEKEEAKMNYEKTRFKMWLIKCRYYASSLMKEVLFYTQESNRCIDEYLSLNLKWIQYKNIIRFANGQCRNELSSQAKTRTLLESFDWSVIESIEKSPDARYDIKKGLIMRFHTTALPVAQKVRKRNFIGIIEVKSTGIEESINLDKNTPLTPIYCEPLEGEVPTKMTLDELHFICYCMAMDDNPIIQTSLFKVMGMSEKGLESVREWLMDYYTYDIPDDSYKKKIMKFQKNNFQDYLIMKTAFKLISYYRRREQVFHLPLPFALRQMDALRRKQLKVSDWKPTPERLGVCYQCHGCQKFANAVVIPMDYPSYGCHCEHTYERNRVYTGGGGGAGHEHDQDIVLSYEGRHIRTVEQYRDKILRHGHSGESNAGCGGGGDEKEAIETEAAEAEEENERMKKNDNISFLNIAAYDVTDGKPYCVRNKRKRITGPLVVPDGVNNVIMVSLDGLTTVSCNKVATTTTSTSNNDEAMMTMMDTDAGGDDDDEDGDGNNNTSSASSSGGGGGGVNNGNTMNESFHMEISRPAYEEDEDIYSLLTNIRHLSKEARERLEAYAKQHTQDLELGGEGGTITNGGGKDGKKKKKKNQQVENNKKIILRAVMAPLHKFYNCHVPLQAIDMIGFVKNGKVFCVECGVMTEYKNYNMTPQGPICMRHQHPAIMKHHPIWNSSSASSITMGSSGSGGENGTHPAPVLTSMGNTKKRPVHSRLLLTTEECKNQCRLCQKTNAVVNLVVHDSLYRLQNIKCCGICHTNIKNRNYKQVLLSFDEVVKFVELKGYPPLVI